MKTQSKNLSGNGLKKPDDVAFFCIDFFIPIQKASEPQKVGKKRSQALVSIAANRIRSDGGHQGQSYCLQTAW
ncbi:hypothetical protein ACFS07_11335 [Undibacterium arcticum]